MALKGLETRIGQHLEEPWAAGIAGSLKFLDRRVQVAERDIDRRREGAE